MEKMPPNFFKKYVSSAVPCRITIHSERKLLKIVSVLDKNIGNQVFLRQIYTVHDVPLCDKIRVLCTKVSTKPWDLCFLKKQ